MKVIMVPIADRPECKLALDEAFRIAASFSANLVGYHLRPHREETHSEHGPRLSLQLKEAELPDEPAELAQLNSANAERLFRLKAKEWNFALARKPRDTARLLAFWNEMVGTPEKLLGIIGPTVDCIVVSRPHRKSSGPARAFLLAALLRTGKPLLVVPQRAVNTLGRRVLVAWDQGVQAASAVTAALPFLKRAEQVRILCCGPENLPGPKGVHLSHYLAHWGVESSVHREKGLAPAKEILSAYRKGRCDLLVMGAYSRSHLRERILGGVTHEMLMKADIPVFALHS